MLVGLIYVQFEQELLKLIMTLPLLLIIILYSLCFELHKHLILIIFIY